MLCNINKINIFLAFFSLRVSKTENNKGRNLYKLLFIDLTLLNLLKTRFFGNRDPAWIVKTPTYCPLSQHWYL